MRRNEKVQIIISDLTGKRLSEYNFNEASPIFTIDNHQWLPGMYFLKIMVNGQSIVRKVVKK